MNLFSPPRRVTRPPPQPAASLRVQSSAEGQARAIGWGQARLAGNLIGFWNFAASAIQESVQGGKGGGGASFTVGYTYSCAVAVGLAEGPIAAVIQGWSNKAPESVAELGFTLFKGGYDQAPWGWLVANQPGYAQNFRGLAYVAAPSFALGGSPALPNLSFEVRFAIAGAVTESAVIPASPYQITAQHFDVTANAVAETLTVPFAAPYQLQAQHPLADTVGLAHDIYVANGSTSIPLPTSDFAGVYYTDTDPPQFLTRVTASPSAGQYSVTAAGLYAFAAADAGTAVTIVDLALAPGVNYASVVTGDFGAGSPVVTALSDIAGIAPGDPVVGAVVPNGTVVTAISGGSATCTVSSGSPIVGVNAGSYAVSPGTMLSDGAGLLPAGTTVTGTGGAIATMNNAATGAATETINVAMAQSGIWGASGVTLGSTSGVVVGASVIDLGGIIDQSGHGGNVRVAGIAGSFVALALTDGTPIGDYSGVADTFVFTTSVTARLHASSQVTDLAMIDAIVPGAAVTDQLGYIPAGTTITASQSASLVLSASATGSAGADVLSFPPALTLSQPAIADAAGASLTVIGPALQQCTVNLGSGLFTLAPDGTYTFAAADAGRRVLITDVPDANPADVVVDFLANPYYGVAQFPAARIGDLATYRAYCQAAGLFVSPVLTGQAAGNQLLQDLMAATNSEFVWSGGTLTVVPYGDTALSGNGASYTPPTQPLYSLGDGDILIDNQATNAASSAAAGGTDPVVLTRLDPADQASDIALEFLDRANAYNPAIAAAQDEAAINAYGPRPEKKQLHFLCDRRAAVQAAHLLLGRQQVRNQYAFTLDRKYILLDPMDIVAITDSGLGLDAQWVRIKEITENDDRSLSIVAEEYLAGAGGAPRYGHQAGAGHAPNVNAAPGDALAPVIIDAPAQLVQRLGIEGWLATNGGPLWGGCEIWLSSDDVNFHFAGTMQGGSVMGVLGASFAAGSDPDTANTLSVDLTDSRGALLPGTQDDADNDRTICYVDGEFVSYQQATLTAQYQYDLGKHGAAAGYLRRGRFGSANAAHAAGTPFVRLKKGTLFQLPYDKSQIGSTIHVKLLSFNLWGGGRQSLDQVASYAHVIGGVAPALSSVGALALADDLQAGAATSSASGHANPGGATTSGTGMVAALVTTIGGAVLVSANGSFGPGTGSPAATKVTLSLQRIDTNGTATIYTGTAMTLPVANNIPFSLTIADAPAIGSVAYQLTGTSDQGVAPFSGTYFSVSELRR